MAIRYTILIIFFPDEWVNFTGCCILCSNSIFLVDMETACREICRHLREYDTSQRKNPALICLFPTIIHGNESKFIFESFLFGSDLRLIQHPSRLQNRELHPQTQKREDPVLWESHCLKVLAPVCECVTFHLVWHLWRLPDQRCWHRFWLSGFWSSSLIQSVFPFVFLMCALFAVVTGATERLLISLSLLMLTSYVIVLPFQTYIPRSPRSV